MNRKLVLTFLLIFPWTSFAVVDRDLVYPRSPLLAEEIMRQVYFVNHHYAVDNFSLGTRRDPVKLVLTSANGRLRLHSFVRDLNNAYSDGVIRHRDRVVFRSGKQRGTGILVTRPADEQKSQSYSIWLPALRKIRRHAEPAQNDAWGGSPFTYGDIYLRKPEHEMHELVGEERFAECLQALDLNGVDQPKAQCGIRDRLVYQLKSRTKFKDWWYDYRQVWVDTETFADYRSVYFKDGKRIKVIDKDWRSMGIDDPRGLYWRYWFAENFVTGRKAMVSVPVDAVRWNQKVKPSLWTEQSLRKIKR